MSTRPLHLRLLLALTAAALVLAACGGDDDDASATTTTEQATTTTTAEEEDGDDPEDEPTDDPDLDPADADPSAGEVAGADADPTAFLLGDKAILLDGFIGVRIPDGWAVSVASPPETSVSPAGGETEVDVDAIDQSLVIGPEEDPRAATFSLLHYSHSDSVPGLDEFDAGILGVLGGDGTQFTEGQSAEIGGQAALLHQLQTPDGDNGVVITLTTGTEYFFILSIVSDDSYAADAGDLVASVSFEPAAIG